MKMNWMIVTLICGIFSWSVSAGDRMIVHEWGTFTSLQNEQGQTIGGVNINEEALPDFVDRLINGLVTDAKPHSALFLGNNQFRVERRTPGSKGIYRYLPIVTMRMETPVIYFHLPRDIKEPIPYDVSVDFQGGWITEWYPEATVDAPGAKSLEGVFEGKLTPQTTGRVEWNNLKVGTNGSLPETNSPVWIAPRQVKADTVTTTGGESEKYLFYRGVGAIESPITAQRNAAGNQLIFSADFSQLQTPGKLSITGQFLVDVRKNGLAFRKLPDTHLSENQRQAIIGSTSAVFEASDYSQENFVKLLNTMREALIKDGLFEDEANALLETWKVSYFQTEGLRFFYLLPKAWTNEVLPLNVKLSESYLTANPGIHIRLQPHIDRVMVGRLEIVKPQQRQLIQKIANLDSISNYSWASRQISKLPKEKQQAIYKKLHDGHIDFQSLGLNAPPEYKLFLELGRFREALIIDAYLRQPNDGLLRFIKNYYLPFKRAQKEWEARSQRAVSSVGN